MKLNLKNYRIQKINKLIKHQEVFFIYTVLDLKTKNALVLNKLLSNKKLKTYKINNNLTNKFLKTSIFSNFCVLFNGPTLILFLKNKSNIDLQPKKLFNINKNNKFIALKINKKIYTRQQLKNFQSFNYKTNIKFFNNSLKRLLKLPATKLNSR